MRISITDRCNLRCRYCMPEAIPLVSSQELLSYEEILQVCRIAVGLGITRFKITGGEPLVRKGCAELIGQMKRLTGVEQVTMTSNGVCLLSEWERLEAAGLDAVNISLDTTDCGRYAQITGYDRLPQVLDAIARAADSRVAAKINAVLQQGANEDWQPLAELARNLPLDVRFIELMPIGHGTSSHAVSNEVLRQRMKECYPSMQPDSHVHGNGPAVYYHIEGFAGTIGFISALHGKYCANCNRIRLTATGDIKPCLCYSERIGIRELLRAGDLQGVEQAIVQAIAGKPQMHCFEEFAQVTETEKMVRIGG